MVALGLHDILKPERETDYRRLLRWVVLLQGTVVIAVGVHGIVTHEPLPEPGTVAYLVSLFDLRRQLEPWFGWAGVILGMVYIAALQLILLRPPWRQDEGATAAASD